MLLSFQLLVVYQQWNNCCFYSSDVSHHPGMIHSVHDSVVRVSGFPQINIVFMVLAFRVIWKSKAGLLRKVSSSDKKNSSIELVK